MPPDSTHCETDQDPLGDPRGYRSGPPALSSQNGLGPHSGTPRLPFTALSPPRPGVDLQTVLDTLSPQMVTAACESLTRLQNVCDDAHTKENLVLELIAAKSLSQETRKWVELAKGRTINLNASVKSQRDLPRVDRLSPEQRLQLEGLLKTMSTPPGTIEVLPTSTQESAWPSSRPDQTEVG